MPEIPIAHGSTIKRAAIYLAIGAKSGKNGGLGRKPEISAFLIERSVKKPHILEEESPGRRMLRPLLGWGGYQRGWPLDPGTGQQLVGMIDALWIILFSTYGFLGLSSAFLSLAVGPWAFLRTSTRSRARDIHGAATVPVDGALISLIVILYMLDDLLNAMQNPAYLLCVGALVSSYPSSPTNDVSNGNPSCACEQLPPSEKP